MATCNASLSGIHSQVTRGSSDQPFEGLTSIMRPLLQTSSLTKHSDQRPNTAHRLISPVRYMLEKVIMPPVMLTSVFRFDTPSPHLKCRLPTCLIVATSNRPSTTVCPRCGKFEFTRYCSPGHLLKDLRRHLITECGTLAIPTAIDESTIGVPFPLTKPYIGQIRTEKGQGLLRDTVERHRQAVYRSTSVIGVDYFIFDDLDRIQVGRDKLAKLSLSVRILHLNRARGTGNVCAVVRIPFPETKKAHFDRLIDCCLSLGFDAGKKTTNQCRTLYLYIVEDLKRQNKWDIRMCEILCVQMGFEIGYQVPVQLRLLPEGGRPAAVAAVAPSVE